MVKNPLEETSKKLLSSKRLYKQVFGAIFSRYILIFINIGFIVPLLLWGSYATFNKFHTNNNETKDSVTLKKSITRIDSIKAKHPCTVILLNDTSSKESMVLHNIEYCTVETKSTDSGVLYSVVSCSWYLWGLLLFATTLAIRTCLKLIEVFNLRREEQRITICYFLILSFIGIFVIMTLVVFDIQNQPRLAAALGVAGTIAAWIFQDTIKGVVAFMHLRTNNLLHIGDWIKIPKHDVDGEVKRVSLTTVTIYNWDTTTSSVPTSLLHSEHFQNLQNMMDGKTYGRRMLRTFVFDTNWFCFLTKGVIEIIEKKHHINLHLSEEEIGEGILNAKVFRLYLYHWLMNNEHISQQPRLILRWMEQKESGLPLQVYAYIIDSKLAAFEWQQSKIIEHIIESASWFNMQLFQEASAYDVSNSNIHLTDKPANYRKEDLL